MLVLPFPAYGQGKDKILSLAIERWRRAENDAKISRIFLIKSKSLVLAPRRQHRT
jgi:hypothetical protein